MNLVMNELFDFLLARPAVAITQSTMRTVEIDEPFRDEIGVLLAGRANLGIGVDEFGMASNKVRRRTPLCDVLRY